MISRLCGLEVHAASTEVGDLLPRSRGALKDPLAPRDVELFEAGGHDRALKLCLEQSPGARGVAE